ncbi:EpsG family protein [Carnobacterium iners]|uniref:EpsG family protein n=1 Tax=Carnobacterium iners TaxID=1073423 RepID=A0A1X7N8Y9_9LACT|nr:EpsG family protein [Carnobacterium iners]SEL07577.1 EpsG family protein [Carnobacterium iners]SMH33991.1 EpsG family protein [Carnobacterium iners]
MAFDVAAEYGGVLSILRHISVGADTFAYSNNYDRISNTRWSDIFDEFIDTIFLGKEGKDLGYTIIFKFIQIFNKNYQFFLILVDIFFTTLLKPE